MFVHRNVQNKGVLIPVCFPHYLIPICFPDYLIPEVSFCYCFSFFFFRNVAGRQNEKQGSEANEGTSEFPKFICICALIVPMCTCMYMPVHTCLFSVFHLALKIKAPLSPKSPYMNSLQPPLCSAPRLRHLDPQSLPYLYFSNFITLRMLNE